jgi:transmembrane sensor
MKSPTTEALSISDEAARWLLELQDDDELVRAHFLAWLRQSPRHVEEFLFVTAAWKKLNHFGRQHAIAVDALLAEAAAEDTSCRKVVPIHEQTTDSARTEAGRKTARAWSMAASVALFIAIGIGGYALIAAGTGYATVAGEQRIIRLDDGSTVRLNTKSKVAVRYGKGAREVRLLQGEALFTVARDETRPFRVEAGETMIQALGTQFNVYRRQSGTVVSVLEGAVRVSAAISPAAPQIIRGIGNSDSDAAFMQLGAGEQVSSSTNGTLERDVSPDVARAVAWQDQKVIFRSDRLEDAVLEVNRYGTRPIRVQGAALKEMRISAIFDASDPEALVRFLRKLDGITVQNTGSEIVIHPTAAGD